MHSTRHYTIALVSNWLNCSLTSAILSAILDGSNYQNYKNGYYDSTMTFSRPTNSKCCWKFFSHLVWKPLLKIKDSTFKENQMVIILLILFNPNIQWTRSFLCMFQKIYEKLFTSTAFNSHTQKQFLLRYTREFSYTLFNFTTVWELYSM